MKTKFIPDRSISLAVIDIQRAIQILSHSIELKGGGDAMANQTLTDFEEPETPESGGQAVFETKIGAFRASVFLNEVDGRRIPSVQLKKSFTNGQGWRHYKMTLLNSKEIDKLICVLQDTKRALYVEFE